MTRCTKKGYLRYAAFDILRSIYSAANCSQKELRAKNRNRDTVYLRQLAAFVLRQHTNLSFPEIGRRLGYFDHSTAMYSVSAFALLVRFNGKCNKKQAARLIEIRRVYWRAHEILAGLAV